ncbi:MAG: class I SAM-dependent methyltransferase [Oligoflexia bacterium]|nr:class I SAM-dependent methyltransferase [Oligoflexia bacterium]
MITERLKKNRDRLRSYLSGGGGFGGGAASIEAYRLYDRDIPEYPYIVDVYQKYLVVYEKGRSDVDENLQAKHFNELMEGLKTLFPYDENIIVKKRQIQDHENFQYQRLQTSNKFFPIVEGNAKFLVNVHDYIDTGLFLDQRPLRFRLYKEVNKGMKVLNLFSYTASFSVVAALKGAQTVSVDWSNTYQNWACENFKLNSLNENEHQFINSDVVTFLEQCRRNNEYLNYFDVIIIDPPTFSNSKKRKAVFSDREYFDVQRDHKLVIELALPLLKSGDHSGRIFFSTNKRDFKISSDLADEMKVVVKDITKQTIPADFRDQKIHHAYLITS